MARLLVAALPLPGHVQPLLPLVAELTRRGHAVTWAPARDLDLRGKRVHAQLAAFIDAIPGQLEDLERLDVPDAIVSDAAHLGAGLYAERHALPWIGVGISALMCPSVDTAPFGSALPPARASRFLNWLVFDVAFASTNRRYRRARVAAGLPAGTRNYFSAMSDDLFLQPTVPSFEYPRRDLPASVRFIGPLVSTATGELPPWWRDVETAAKPIVLVTQGTLATDPRELIEPALRALANDDVLVVATANVDAPANARVAPFVPFADLMPRVAAMVTNGGYGGVQMALAHGVPLVVAGGSEEKPEIAARVAWSGAGLDLRTGRPSPRRIAAAVRRVLVEPGFRERAGAIAREMATYDAPRRGADLIEARLEVRRAA